MACPLPERRPSLALAVSAPKLPGVRDGGNRTVYDLEVSGPAATLPQNV